MVGAIGIWGEAFFESGPQPNMKATAAHNRMEEMVRGN
jgi:hypothetical protein